MTTAKKLEGLCRPGSVLVSPAVAAACRRAAAAFARPQQPTPPDGLCGRRLPPALLVSDVVLCPRGSDDDGAWDWPSRCSNSSFSPAEGSSTAAARGKSRWAGLAGLWHASFRSFASSDGDALPSSPVAALCSASDRTLSQALEPAALGFPDEAMGDASEAADSALCSCDDGSAGGPPVEEDDGPAVHVAAPGMPVLFGRA
jgi:hypothetical protein